MSPFSAFRSITSSVRIKTLLVCLRSCKISAGESFVSFHVVFSCFHGSVRSFVSDATCSPRVAERIFGFVHVAVEWRHWGALSCDWRSLFCVRARKLFVSRWYYFDLVLDAFGWSLQPMVRREIRIQLPDRQRTSKLKREDERERF